MKQLQNLISLTGCILILLAAFGCSEDKNPVNPGGPNVLLNSTFENNGNPDAGGWKISARPLGEIVNEAPPSGGIYSVRLMAATPEGGQASITIPANSDKQIYKLSFWAKTNAPSSQVYFDLLRNSQLEVRNGLNVEDTVWTQYSFVDTLQVMSGDSIRVIFQERLEPILLRETYYDLCTVEYLD